MVTFYLYDNIIFSNSRGKKDNINISQEHSMNTLLKHYLIRKNQKDRITQLKEGKNEIIFLFNASKIKFGDKTKIKDFFKNCNLFHFMYSNNIKILNKIILL